MLGLNTLPHFHSGKVRDTYEIPGNPDLLLMVASDRISTHNVVHRSLVPQKGELLTALTVFWHRSGLVGPTHLVAAGSQIWKYIPSYKFDHTLSYRGVVVRKRKPHPVEFIWRRYLTGSLEKALRAGNDPYGLSLPSDLPRMHRFGRPIFTPTHKSEHDEPMNAQDAFRQYARASGRTYKAFVGMEKHLSSVGITLIDGKSESDDDMLLDEIGTGDCCRMAWSSQVHEGENPPWLDKEEFRQEAERQWGSTAKIPLTFTEDTLRIGIKRYHDAFEAITGTTLTDFQREMFV